MLLLLLLLFRMLLTAAMAEEDAKEAKRAVPADLLDERLHHRFRLGGRHHPDDSDESDLDESSDDCFDDDGRAGGGGQGGQSGRPRPRLRPLAVYKPSFRLGDKLDDDEGQALLGPARATAAASVGAARSQPPPVPARRRREVAPSSGCPGKLGQDPWEGDRDGDGVGSNCCCGAVALPALPALPSGLGFPWARTSPPQPQPPPQHQPDKHKAMNTRGIFSHTLSGDPPAADTLLPPPHRHHHQQQQQQQQQQQLLRLQPPSRGPGAGGPGVLGTGREERGGSTPLLGPPPPWSATASGTATRVPDGPGAPVPAAAPAVGGAARSVRRYSDDPGDDTARDEDADDEDGVRKMLEAPRRKELPPLPPLPSTPLKRRVLVRTKQDLPTYGVAALLPHAPPAAAAPPGAPVPAGPMDRFNKFRFGGRVDDIKKSNGRTPRTSDKTERLRELTGRLRAGPERADRGGGGAGGDRAPAPPTPSPSPSPSPSPTPAVSASPAPAPAAAAATAPAGAGPPQADSAAKEDDLFDLRLARPESRAIVGSYIQRTIPFRSASFSQVDFTDGKYFRHSPRATWLCPLSAATLPRKKAPTDEASPVTSSASIAAVETPGAEGSAEPTGSTPSVDSAVESAVDSAVGSDEGCFEPAVLSLMGPPRVAAKPPGSRSMTHPLPSRTCAARADRGSPLSSSVEADGLRGLRHPCQGGAATPESLLADSRPDSGALLGVVADPRLSNSTSSMESDAEAAARDASAGSFGSLGPPTTTAGTNEGDIKPLENPVSYEVFVRQFPNYKEYEKWMNESVLANDGAQAVCKWQHPSEFTNGNSNDSNNNPAVQTDSKPAAPEPPALASAPALTPTPIPDVVEHDDRCINYFDPTTCPKCLEQMETGPSILQKLKASFHMEDLELEPHEKELYSRHTDLLLRKWAPTKAKHPFERSKSEPKETGKEDAKAVLGLAAKDPMTFQRTKSTDEAERESAPEPPLISLPSSDEKDTPEPRPPLAGAAVGAGNSAAGQSHADEELKRRRPKDEPRPRRWLERPKLICQSSDERDDESSAGSATPAASRPRFPLVGRSDSLSEGESDQCDRRPSTPSRTSPSPSLYPHLDLSDSEGAGRAGAHAPPQGHGHGAASQRSPHTPRRYSKRPLRGPYGQMLEAEMKKPEANRKLSQYTDDLKFLEEYPSKASGSSQSLVVLSPSAAAAGSAELTRSVSSGEQRQAAAPRNRHQGAGAHSMDDSQLRAAVAAVAAAAPSVCLGPASAAGSAKAGAPRRKVSATELPFACLNPNGEGAALPVCHQRTTSSPSQLEGIAARADVDLFRRQAPRQRNKEEAIVDPANVTWKVRTPHLTCTSRSLSGLAGVPLSPRGVGAGHVLAQC
ncbi:hypothetical protein ONE63_000252 [Megalurothrips usitatus]|uniref:Nascent polypeptide-associated complex subunit alpha, muscle-specific form-like n=1 Tax=Megalurothrips usitatus TaxID=439358 RepID=A0AAV7XXV6_9NEOP|nr:hypothetical protein ONE63_000252 [Megalurothrips usitatus]